MNKTATEGVSVIKNILSSVQQITSVDIAICPPFTSLASGSALISQENVWLGAQNMHHEPLGAYTGEISASMLKDLSVSCVILGHSERRSYFGETDEFINKKVLSALQNHLIPILCVGETLEEREQNRTMEVISRQVRKGVAGIPEQAIDQLVLAYEPVWAIGTGRTATPEMAQEAYIRKLLSEIFSQQKAEKVRILYGGSMKPDNAASLLAQPDVDGGLIGGASLDAASFVNIIKSAL